MRPSEQAETNSAFATHRGGRSIQLTHPFLKCYTPIAPAGGLSPCSTTSIAWPKNAWPIKPEIVLEGGNIAYDTSKRAIEVDDLLLLTTHHEIDERHFTVFGQTSAATAYAAYLAAKIYAEYPNIWPETVRGLLVHSATWTDAMKAQFLKIENKKGVQKADYRNLLRSCGYGAPRLGEHKKVGGMAAG